MPDCLYTVMHSYRSMGYWLCLNCLTCSEASIPPETMMHFPPLFQIFPLFSKNFQTPWKICQLLPFPDKFFHFHPPKFLMTFFLVIDHKFRISPLFSLFSYISPSFPKIFISPPTSTNF